MVVVRIIYYVYLVIMIGLYLSLCIHMPETEVKRVSIIGLLNVGFLLLTVWWLARTRFYIVWGVYLLVLTGYFGFIYPALPMIPALIVYGTGVLITLVSVYDIVIDRCRGIETRSRKRFR